MVHGYSLSPAHNPINPGSGPNCKNAPIPALLQFDLGLYLAAIASCESHSGTGAVGLCGVRMCGV